MKVQRVPQQKGVAIVMVLLIVALATSLAAYIAMQQSLWQRQVESQFERAQSRQIGLAGIDWARAILAEDKRSNNIDHETELWTLKLPAIPLEGGEVVGSIEDRQGLYNLNNVVNNMAQFQRLLDRLDLPETLAPALADWLEPGDVPRPGGAKDSYYLALAQPYRTSARLLVELSELTKIKGFDSKTISTLRPFVSVLPDSRTKVNINFAPAEVLVAVINGLTLSDARLIVQQRKEKPYKDIEDIKQRLPQRGITILDTDISVSSDYFWVTGQSTSGQSQVITQALLKRENFWPVVEWQSVQ